MLNKHAACGCGIPLPNGHEHGMIFQHINLPEKFFHISAVLPLKAMIIGRFDDIQGPYIGVGDSTTPREIL